MSWVKIDDSFATHRKMRDAGMEATCLWVSGLAFCSRYRTNGFVTRGDLSAMWPWADVDHLLQLAAKLVSAGLWDDSGDAWTVHDYLQYQLSREESDSRRAAALKRMQGYRKREEERRSVTPNERVRDAERKRANLGRDGTGLGSGSEGEVQEGGSNGGHAGPSAAAQRHRTPKSKNRPMKSAMNSSVQQVWNAICEVRAANGLDVLPATIADAEHIGIGLKLAPSVEKLVQGVRAAAEHLDTPWRGGGSWREHFTPRALMANVSTLLAWADANQRDNGKPPFDDMTPEALDWLTMGKNKGKETP